MILLIRADSGGSREASRVISGGQAARSPRAGQRRARRPHLGCRLCPQKPWSDLLPAARHPHGAPLPCLGLSLTAGVPSFKGKVQADGAPGEPEEQPWAHEGREPTLPEGWGLRRTRVLAADRAPASEQASSWLHGWRRHRHRDKRGGREPRGT